MKYKELKDKSQEELEKLYRELCQKRQELNFKLANKQIKNVREARVLKKNMAQLLTLLNK